MDGYVIGGSSKLCLLSLPPSTQLSNRAPGAAKGALVPTKGTFRILFLGYVGLNQTKTKPCSISRDRFCQLPARFVSCRILARVDGPLQRLLEGPES